MSSTATQLPATDSTRTPFGSLFVTRDEQELFEALLTERPGADPRAERVAVRPLAMLGRSVELRREAGDARALHAAVVAMDHVPPARLPESPVIVVLGAGPGYGAADLSARFVGARVVAVEMTDDTAALCAENLRGLGDRGRVITGAAWGGEGIVGWGGEATDARRVTNLGAFPGFRAPAVIGQAEALSVPMILARANVDCVDYLHMDVAGSEATIFDGGARPGEWLTRCGCVSVIVRAPATVESVEWRLVEAGMRTWRDPRVSGRVVGMSRACVAAQPRWPKDAAALDAPPGPW